MSQLKAFLDMDGVIADFLGSALALHGSSAALYDLPTSKGVWDTDKLLGITPSQFWVPLDGPDFWSDLAKTPEADEIVATVEQRFGSENVAILTAPSASPHCIPGKLRWIERHFPQFKKRIIFGSCKEFMASPSRVLVDDRDHNVESFRTAGGLAVLVPRPWNRKHDESQVICQLEYQLKQIEERT